MIKILFVIPTFNHGGSNRHLFNILSMIDAKKYQIDIFSIVDIGPYKTLLSNYNILTGSFVTTSIFQQYDSIRKERLFNAATKTLIKIFYRLVKIVSDDKAYKLFMGKTLSRLQGYDSVMAVEEGITTRFVHYIKTKNRIAYVHCDYSYYYKVINKSEESIYLNFNSIVCVSKYTREVFINYYPSLKNRVQTIYNVLDSNRIIKLSEIKDEIDTRFDGSFFSLVSIGRLSPIKQFDIIPDIAKRLLTAGCKFKWYIIGDGEEYAKISEQITLNDVEDTVTMLGEKLNPYPYLLKSDILVCTSESEAYPTVINEAKLLGTFVVTTDFKSAKEVVNDKIDGFIVSKSEFADTLEKLIKKGRRPKQKISMNFENELMNLNNIKQFENLLDYEGSNDKN